MMAGFMLPSLFVRARMVNTPLPARYSKILKDWSCLRSPIPVFGGPLPPVSGDEKELSGSADLDYAIEMPKREPFK